MNGLTKPKKQKRRETTEKDMTINLFICFKNVRNKKNMWFSGDGGGIGVDVDRFGVRRKMCLVRRHRPSAAGALPYRHQKLSPSARCPR
jgi:hypothetical protein